MIIGEGLFIVLSFVITCGLICKFVFPMVKNNLENEIAKIRKTNKEDNQYIMSLKHEVDALNSSIGKVQSENQLVEKKLAEDVEKLKKINAEQIKLNKIKEQALQDMKYNKLQLILSAKLKNCIISNINESMISIARSDIKEPTIQNRHIENAITRLKECEIN